MVIHLSLSRNVSRRSTLEVSDIYGNPILLQSRTSKLTDAAGLGSEGIYRISGRKTGIQQVYVFPAWSWYIGTAADSKTIQDIERDEAKFNFEEKDDVYSITNVLKQCKLIAFLTFPNG